MGVVVSVYEMVAVELEFAGTPIGGGIFMSFVTFPFWGIGGPIAGAHWWQHHKDQEAFRNRKPEDTKTPLLDMVAHGDPLRPRVCRMRFALLAA